MDILLALYFVVGLIFGMERLSRVTKDDEHGMVSIGIMAIIVLWPLYLMYKVWEKRVIHNMKDRCKKGVSWFGPTWRDIESCRQLCLKIAKQ